MLISDYLDICDPVLTFDRFMGEIELEKYLKSIPRHYTGRIRYNPVSMLKTVLFGFMTNGYISLRELEDQCKVNLRFMYLMEHETPSYRTFGYFINEVIGDSVEDIFNDINKKIFEKEHVDLQHLYIDGSKFEANANKYSWVWKKATEKSRYRLFDKITAVFQEINEEIAYTGMQFSVNTEYAPEYIREAAAKYAEMWQLDEALFVHGKGRRKTMQYRQHVKGNNYGRQEEVYTCEDCSGCPYAERCKKTDKNRTVRINRELTSMHHEVMENLESIHGALLRMNRTIQAEGTFGITKNDRCYSRIVRRGIESVRLEVFLVSIGQNLYKFHNKQKKAQAAA